MDKSQTTKVIVACVFLLIAGVLILKFTGGSAGVTERRYAICALEEMPVEDLISMRQALAAQVAEANRTRTGEKSDILLGFEETLANYDAILDGRGVDLDELGTPSLAEVPLRKGEGP